MSQGIYAEAWQNRLRWLMSYVRPLSWMAWLLLLKILSHMLSMLAGLVAAIILLYAWWATVDYFNLPF